MNEGPFPTPNSGAPPKGYFSDPNPYGVTGNPAAWGPQRGMIGHVPIAAALTVVQALMEAMMAAVGLFGLIMFSTLKMPVRPGQPPPPDPAFMVGVFGWIFATATVACVCHLVAAIGMFNHRWRTTCLVAQWIGLVSIGTIYCAPTGIGISIYSLLVLMNEPVAWAFRRVTEGAQWSDINRGMPPGATN